MTAWLHIIGVTEEGPGQLSGPMRLLLSYAETVLGPQRFLADLEPMAMPRSRAVQDVSPDVVNRRSFEAVARALAGESVTPSADRNLWDGRRLVPWESPLEAMLDQVMTLRDTPTVILASGDPLWFGIAATMAKHLPASEFAVYPAPSSFQLAAARLRWPLQHATTLSLHARPIEFLHPHIMPGNRILALTTDHMTVESVIDLLVERGYGRSRLITLENLGGSDERITTGEAEGFDTRDVEDFYVLGIECVPGLSAALLTATPGLPDELFTNDGQLTKREIRAATLGKLMPFPGAVLWDVGAGAGSIAIEWLRAARDTKALAFESEGERLEMIAVNAAALGVPHIEIVSGEAPATFVGKAPPDAVFLGGDVANIDLFDACWTALKPGGRFVANAVTLEGELTLAQRHAQLGGDLVRIEVSAIDRIGAHRAFRPRMAVTQWSVTKAPHGFATNP